jgi:hypothetical protein
MYLGPPLVHVSARTYPRFLTSDPQKSNRGTTESDLYPPRPRSQPVHGGTIGPSCSSELDRPSGAKLLPQIISPSSTEAMGHQSKESEPGNKSN